jgi:hypothetical protein
LSILIELYIWSVILVELKTLLWNENPYISKITVQYDDPEAKIYVRDTSKIIIGFNDFRLIQMDI